tara:strand:+ start:418 stop:1281 length:864 start_codon:yes stop_codon:yes gene_type:complete
MNNIDKIDLKISKFFFDLFNKNTIKYIPQIFGLIPYEFYVIPGMYIAILQVIWLGTPNPVQFHLLPHWFAYSIFQFLKKTIKRPRPGCFNKNMNKYINAGHCINGHQYQSFPSGHAGVAASLATALFMEVNYSDNPKFFEIPIDNPKHQKLISFLCLFIVIMVSLHRVSKGYHSILDVMIGILIGSSIGFISWTSLEYFKKAYHNVCQENASKGYDAKACKHNKLDNNDQELLFWIRKWKINKLKLHNDFYINTGIMVTRIILTIPILLLLYKFLVKDVFNLASIKH